MTAYPLGLFLCCGSLLVCSGALGAAPKEGAMDVKLEVKQAKRVGDRWVVQVALAFHNGTGKPIDLDKRTVCDGGHLSNHVFDVRQGEQRVDYLGEMAKRAHPGPDGFTVVKPGGTYEVLVELGGKYRFPVEGGEFTVGFDSFNHFSKDKLKLSSNRVAFTLAP